MAVSASFIDPYLVIIRDDASVLLLKADESGDLDEVSLPDEISTSQWRSGCLYHDKSQAFNAAGSSPEDSKGSEALLFLLNSECKLLVSYREKEHSGIESDVNHRYSDLLI